MASLTNETQKLVDGALRALKQVQRASKAVDEAKKELAERVKDLRLASFRYAEAVAKFKPQEKDE